MEFCSVFSVGLEFNYTAEWINVEREDGMLNGCLCSGVLKTLPGKDLAMLEGSLVEQSLHQLASYKLAFLPIGGGVESAESRATS